MLSTKLYTRNTFLGIVNSLVYMHAHTFFVHSPPKKIPSEIPVPVLSPGSSMEGLLACMAHATPQIENWVTPLSIHVGVFPHGNRVLLGVGSV